MGEARVLMVHLNTHRVLKKWGSGDCLAELSEQTYKGEPNHGHFSGDSNVAIKLEVFEKNSNGEVQGMWLRNDHHPQRSLACSTDGNSIEWLEVWSKSRADVHWDIEFHEYLENTPAKGDKSTTKCVIAVKNRLNQKYLSANGKKLDWSSAFNDHCLWGLVPVKGSLTPGQASAAIIGSAVAVAAVAVTGGALFGAGGAAATAGAAATEAGAAAAATGAAATSASAQVALTGAALADAGAAMATVAEAGAVASVFGGQATAAVGAASIATTQAAAAAGAVGAVTAAAGGAATAAGTAAVAAGVAATSVGTFMTVGAVGMVVFSGSMAAAILPLVVDAKNSNLWVFKC